MKKKIIGNLSKIEADIIRDLREMPEIVNKIIKILKARQTMKRVCGRFINERVSDDI